MSEDCIFCRIARGELGTEFVGENEDAVAFADVAPQTPVHLLVVSKSHIPALRSAGPDEARTLANSLLLASQVAKEAGLNAGGYRVITNDGSDAGQTVAHLHFHVLGGKELGPLG